MCFAHVSQAFCVLSRQTYLIGLKAGSAGRGQPAWALRLAWDFFSQSFPSTTLAMIMASPVSPVTLMAVAGASVMVPMRTMMGMDTVGKPNTEMMKISATYPPAGIPPMTTEAITATTMDMKMFLGGGIVDAEHGAEQGDL